MRPPEAAVGESHAFLQSEDHTPEPTTVSALQTKPVTDRLKTDFLNGINFSESSFMQVKLL